MAFDNKLLSRSSTSLTEKKIAVKWIYGPSADNLATITASAFFNDVAEQLSKNDMFYIVASDATDIREVSSDTGVKPVTVASFITAGDLADNSVTTSKIADGAVTQVKVSPNSLDGTVARNVADANVIGGIPVLFRINTPGGATANTDVIITNQIRVIDAWVVNRAAGTASDTIRVFNLGDNITDAMDVNKSDTVVTRAGELVDAFVQIPSSGTLRITQTDGGGSDSPATTVYVLAVRVV